MVSAHEADEEYGRFLKSVVGIVFLGTPHRGSAVASVGKLVSQIINGAMLTPATGIGPKFRSDLLENLERSSMALRDLNSSVKNRLRGIKIISFYETSREASLSVVRWTVHTMPRNTGRGEHLLNFTPDC